MNFNTSCDIQISQVNRVDLIVQTFSYFCDNFSELSKWIIKVGNYYLLVLRTEVILLIGSVLSVSKDFDLVKRTCYSAKFLTKTQFHQRTSIRKLRHIKAIKDLWFNHLTWESVWQGNYREHERILLTLLD